LCIICWGEKLTEHFARPTTSNHTFLHQN
jgi:hypothetical protein